MTEQKKDSSSQENEKSNYPAQILTVEEVKAELINQWNKKVDIPSSDVFLFLVDALAEATAQNYALCSQVLELQTGYTELAKANLSRKQELVSITFEQKRIHADYEQKFTDLADRISGAGL